MPRGGARPGAGRKKFKFSPDAINALRARIKSDWIIKHLLQHISGEREMSPSAVTASLGLLKKTVPDLSSVELSGSVDGKLIVNIVRHADDNAA